MENEIKKFKTTMNKGFHITFDNGWTVSVQFGFGNYCDNYSLSIEKQNKIFQNAPDMSSDNAEVWCWNNQTHETYPEEPLSHQTPEEVLKIMNEVSKR